MIKFLFHKKGQSAVELAIFGSILMLVVSMIFRQGLNSGNFMNTQLKATRYAMSKSFESSTDAKPTRSSASVLMIEDRLGGDFTNKFSSRDRVPLVASGGGVFSNQLLYPVDEGDCEGWEDNGVAACDQEVLTRFDILINGQKFPFTVANFRIIELPKEKGDFVDCGGSHPADTRCWDATCSVPGGCLRLHYQVQNYSGSDYNAAAGNEAFDPNFDNNYVPEEDRAPILPGEDMKFSWQWAGVLAKGKLPINNSLDVDGDFYEEQILASTADAKGLTDKVLVIDRQAGDIDFSIDGRRPMARSGLLDESQMFSSTNQGTYFKVQEGKLYDPRNDQYIRNVNRTDQVDVVQRVIQLSNDTGRFCANGSPQPLVDGYFNSVEACNNCFSAANFQKTCLDILSLQLFVRSRISNQGGRSWFTQTEARP